jgi:hypothetical protein
MARKRKRATKVTNLIKLSNSFRFKKNRRAQLGSPVFFCPGFFQRAKLTFHERFPTKVRFTS